MYSGCGYGKCLPRSASAASVLTRHTKNFIVVRNVLSSHHFGTFVQPFWVCMMHVWKGNRKELQMEISSFQQQSKPQPTSHSLGVKLRLCTSASSDRRCWILHRVFWDQQVLEMKAMALSWLYLPQERTQVPASLGTALPVACEPSLTYCSLGWPPYFVWRWLWERSLLCIKALLCHLMMGERTAPGLFCSQHKPQCHICLWLH